MTTELIAFLDESRKPVRNPWTGRVDQPERTFYVVAAGVVISGDISGMRSQLGRVEAEIGCPLHYQDLGVVRRAKAFDAIDKIDGWDGYLFETIRPLPDAHYNEHHIRSKVLGEAFAHLSAEGVTEAVLETRAGTKRDFQPLDRKDHQVLRKLQRQEIVPNSFLIRHDDKTEAILQLADLLAGARSEFSAAPTGKPSAGSATGSVLPALSYIRVTERAEAPGLRSAADPGRTSGEVLGG